MSILHNSARYFKKRPDQSYSFSQAVEFRSWDKVDPSAADTVYSTIPDEALNLLEPSGLPPHRLLLKIGAPIILIRNLRKEGGLMNGTRLIVRRLMSLVIEAEIVTGSHAGDIALLPRLNMTSSDDALPFALKRRQFPIRLAFAMSINKSQGQTFDKVGIFLPTPCFSHGQLYVAMSRVGTEAGVTICTADEESPDRAVTKNPVWPELLL